jgi:hypothetical protein
MGPDGDDRDEATPRDGRPGDPHPNAGVAAPAMDNSADFPDIGSNPAAAAVDFAPRGRCFRPESHRPDGRRWQEGEHLIHAGSRDD